MGTREIRPEVSIADAFVPELITRVLTGANDDGDLGLWSIPFFQTAESPDLTIRGCYARNAVLSRHKLRGKNRPFEFDHVMTCGLLINKISQLGILMVAKVNKLQTTPSFG